MVFPPRLREVSLESAHIRKNMKTKILTIALFFAVVSLFAADVILRWPASTSPGVGTYQVYSSTNNFDATNATWKLEKTVTATSGTNTTTVTVTAPPTIAFSVVAVSTNGSLSARTKSPIIFRPADLQVQEAD